MTGTSLLHMAWGEHHIGLASGLWRIWRTAVVITIRNVDPASTIRNAGTASLLVGGTIPGSGYYGLY